MIAKEQLVDQPAGKLPPPLVKRFLDYLFVECGLAGHTIVAYQGDLCRFWETVQTLGVDTEEIAIDVVRHHLTVLREEGMGVASIARHLVVVEVEPGSRQAQHHQQDQHGDDDPPSPQPEDQRAQPGA